MAGRIGGSGAGPATARMTKVGTITGADIAALGAIQTATLDVVTLPARTLVRSVLLVITSALAGVTTLTFDLGYDPQGPYADYFYGVDLKAAGGNWVKGMNNPLTQASSVPFAAIPSLTVPTPMKAVLTCTTGAETFATVTGLVLDIYFDTLTLP